MIRFGNESDGSYPGGAEILGEGSYLVVDDEASAELKALADAIVTNTNFSWGKDGYTIYLGSGAISGSADPDIVDYIGFGPEAKYYEGASPAPAFAPSSILIRKANAQSTVTSLSAGGSDELAGHNYDTNNNQADFVLLILNPDPVIPDDDEGNGGGDDNPATSTEVVVSSTPKIVISRVAATGDDDWIDLYNNSDTDFDLAVNNYHLEKSKSAVDPVIIMRFGNESDGTYPRGTIIKARSYYRVVRDEASVEIKATADAIASGNNFTFDGSGYTLYLGLDSISAPDDADIIDLVGFGVDAVYYEGSGPAPEILDQGFLSRKVSATSTRETLSENGLEFDLGAAYDSNDNQFDFVLIGSVVGPVEPNNGYNSPGLAHLWHFNECRGNILKDSVGTNDFNYPATWRVGKWGCALEQYYAYPKLQTNFNQPLNSAGVSILFNYQNTSASGKTSIYLAGPAGGVEVVFDPNFTRVNGLPTLFYSSDIKWPRDSVWHQGVLVINGTSDYWELYLDGERVYQEYFEAIFSKDFARLEIGNSDGYNYLDEVGIWSRALSGAEIKNIFLSQSELAPTLNRSAQLAPVEIHHWSFDERSGNLALDDIASSSLFIDSSQWVRLGHQGPAILHNMYANRKMELNFSQEIKEMDLSLDFWWCLRNDGGGQSGKISLLVADNKAMFALVASAYRPKYYFNSNSGIISEGFGLTLPHDSAWHHLVLVYDSYEYKLNFYVDGELKYSTPQTWLLDEAIKKMEIYNANWKYEIDDLSIWRGALKAQQVKTIYQNETGGN